MANSFISYLCKAVGDKVLEEGSLVLLDAQNEAKTLEQKLNSIQAVLVDAERREIHEESVQAWLDELKHVAYDIEDLLDDWTIAEVQLQDQLGLQRGNNYPIDPSTGFLFKEAKSRGHYIAHRIVEINRRLCDIAERKSAFHFVIIRNRDEKFKRIPATTSFGKILVLPSQERTKETLIKRLLHDEAIDNVVGSIPVISITGMGGTGKTTLAQSIYNDPRIKEAYPYRSWVRVSEAFDDQKVSKAIAESVGLNVNYLDEMQSVLDKIDSFIEEKKFLLVLDGVWTEGEGNWDQIQCCIGDASDHGSKILLTARSETVAEKMKSSFTFSMETLLEDESWSLFSHFAFSERTVDEIQRLEDIARKVANKCKGLPLALEVLGRFMFLKKNTNEWEDILRSELWEREFENGVFTSLVFSYVDLPSAVKRCFALCSLFPKGTPMSKNLLIRIWMAHGFLQEKSEMEVVGEEYFDCLVTRAFFQVKESNEDDIMVTVNDIIHDFAQHISNNEVAHFFPSTEKDFVPTRLRHVLFSDVVRELDFSCSGMDFLCLRSLVLSLNSITVLRKLFSSVMHLRMLDIKFFGPETLDQEVLKDIGKMIHLRYLRLHIPQLTSLPQEICDLQFLHTLDLYGCHGLTKLPEEIGRLTSLRHLLIRNRNRMDVFPKEIGRLSALRTLSKFCFVSSSLDSEHCNLEDLKELTNLQGKLRIETLNQVACVDEAVKAEMHKKVNVHQLTFEFGDGDASIQSKVLEALWPAKENLDNLKISHYKGRTFPQWVAHLISVKEVELDNVSVENLPPLGILPSLEQLKVSRANKVKRVGEELLGTGEQQKAFPMLRTLEFEDMYEWELWVGPKQTIEDHGLIMSSLRHLKIRDCDKLKALPDFMKAVPLDSIDVFGCKFLQVEEDSHKELHIGGIITLQRLENIHFGYDMTSFVLRDNDATVQSKAGLNAMQQRHLSFKYLEMKYYELRLFPGWIMYLTNLKEISLHNVCFKYLPPFGLLPCLEELRIRETDVEEVGDEFLGIADDEHRDREGRAAFVAFSKLRKLYFEDMWFWKEWKDPQIQATVRNDLTVMPSLCDMKIAGSDELKTLPHFFGAIPLELFEVGGSDMPRIRNSEEDEPSKMTNAIDSALAQNLKEIKLTQVENLWFPYWRNYLVSLKKVYLTECEETRLPALGVLPSLEILHITYCNEIKHVGKEILWTEEDLEEEQEKLGTKKQRLTSFVAFPSLKKLIFHGMFDWEEWEDPDLQLELESGDIQHNSFAIIIMPCLRALSFHGCPKLQALPRFIQKAPLEKLTIIECPALKTWWKHEAGEAWLRDSNIPQVTVY